MKNNDFIKVDFVGRIVSTSEIFDLTLEDIAKKEGIHTHKQKYVPMLVILGADMIIPGIEKELLKMKLKEEKEITVKPDEAFGTRNPKLIKILPFSKFMEKKIKPFPGLFVDIDGMKAKIQSVSGGRVRVDFNHPLAGKELNYKIKIVSIIEKPLEKAKSILDYYNIKAYVELKEGVLTVKIEKKIEKMEVVEKFITETIIKYIKDIKKVVFKDFSQKI